MSFYLVFSQLARYGDQVTLSGGAFLNRHIVFPSQLSTLLFAISTAVMQLGMRVGYFKYTIGILQG